MDKKIKLKKMFPKVANFRKCLIKVGDEVKVIAGKEKGKTGKIIDFDRKRGRVKVQSLNMMTHFVKKDQNRNIPGGIETKEGFLNVSNVMFVSNGVVTKLGRNQDGKRISKKTGELI